MENNYFEILQRIIESLPVVWQFIVGATSLSALLSAAIGLAKKWNLVKDGQSKTVFKTVQAVTVVALAVLKAFAPDFDLGVFEQMATEIVNTYGGLLAIALPFMDKFGEIFYQAIKGIPLLGHSFSEQDK